MKVGFFIDYYYGSWVIIIIVKVKNDMGIVCIYVLNKFYFDY